MPLLLEIVTPEGKTFSGDVESVVRIKKLLYHDGFTIAGARVQLREETKSDRSQTTLPFPMSPSVNVSHFRNELQQILHILSPRRQH